MDVRVKVVLVYIRNCMVAILLVVPLPEVERGAGAGGGKVEYDLV